MSASTPIDSLSAEVSMHVLRRLERKIQADGECWRWLGAYNENGYGKIDIPSGVPAGKKGWRRMGAHRASWIAHRGDIPEGLVVDHLCRHTWCVNPWHLDLVTSAVNNARKEAILALTRPPRKPRASRAVPGAKRGGHQWAKGTCSGGHDITKAENIFFDRNGRGSEVRRCIICAIAKLRSKQRLPQEAAP